VLKNLFLLALLSVLGFLGWRHFKTPPPTLTAEQEVAAVVEQSVIPAKDLAAMCSKHPKLVTRALKGKKVAVSGVLSKALVSGVNSNDLQLELAGTPQLKISFQSDFGKAERWGGPARFRFQKKGKEILGLSVVKAPVGDKENTDRVYSQLDTSSEAAVLQSVVGKIADAYGAVKSPGGSKPSSSKKTAEKSIQRTVCREGDASTLRGEFRHIGSGWVKFDLLELP
jgi:hypothetical protein